MPRLGYPDAVERDAVEEICAARRFVTMRQGRSSYTSSEDGRFTFRSQVDWLGTTDDSYEQAFAKPRRSASATSLQQDFDWEPAPSRRREKRRHRDDAYFEPGVGARRGTRRDRQRTPR